MTIRFSVVALAAIITYSIGAIAYVSICRGRIRYASVSQYLRKSWPIFAPLNCLMYMSTLPYGRKAVLDADFLKNIELIRDNWQVIRNEALALESSGAFDDAKAPGSVGYYDVGFRTFYKRGWSKFYLMWYGTTHVSALRMCPQTIALLERVPGIRGAMFSILPPGAELTLHSDPMACSLRYHLGLATPNSPKCNITVDGMQYSWADGKDFVFDETYPHFARNDTDRERLILMCDVDRPMRLVGRIFHRLYIIIAKTMLVPNTKEDARGLLSLLFNKIAPAREKALKFRERHRITYFALKLMLNSTLLFLLMVIFFSAFSVIEMMVV